MTGATAGVGLLPGYAAIGLLARILILLLRAAQGLAAGGELRPCSRFRLGLIGFHLRRRVSETRQLSSCRPRHDFLIIRLVSFGIVTRPLYCEDCA
jgi:hypothetical protein